MSERFKYLPVEFYERSKKGFSNFYQSFSKYSHKLMLIGSILLVILIIADNILHKGVPIFIYDIIGSISFVLFITGLGLKIVWE